VQFCCDQAFFLPSGFVVVAGLAGFELSALMDLRLLPLVIGLSFFLAPDE